MIGGFILNDKGIGVNVGPVTVYPTRTIQENIIENLRPTNVAEKTFREVQGENAVPLVHEWLSPIGGPFYTNPPGAVSPFDCDRWPNSPYCGGMPNPWVPFTPGLNLTRTACEICFSSNPTVLWIQGPTSIICKRNPACNQIPQTPPEADNNENIPANTSWHVANPPRGKIRVVYALSYARWDRGFWRSKERRGVEDGCLPEELRKQRQSLPFGGAWFPGLVLGWDEIPGWNFPFAPPEWGVTVEAVNKYRQRGGSRTNETPVEVSVAGREAMFPCTTFSDDALRVDVNTQSVLNVSIVKWIDVDCDAPQGAIADAMETLANDTFHRTFPSNLGPPPPAALYTIGSNCPIKFDPPHQPLPGKPMACNCEEIERMLEEIHFRLGVAQFPFSLPADLRGDGEEQTPVEDYASTFAYLLVQLDNLIGEFPVKILIDDTDPTTQGNQSLEVELPNIADGLAEIFGLVYKDSITSDLGLQATLRTAAEVISTKNSSLVTQDYVKAITSFLGFRGNPTRRRIDYAFDITAFDNFRRLFNSSRKEIIGFENQDSETVVDYLQRLMFAAGIIKSAFMTVDGTKDNLVDAIRNTISDGDGIGGEDTSRLDEFIREVNDLASRYNIGSTIKPRASKRDIS